MPTIYELLDATARDRGIVYFPSDNDYSNVDQISNSYFLQKLTIKIKGGEVVSMAEVFQNMEIFEDIYSSALHGTIDILDMAGGFSKYVISGGETISIVACKSVDDTSIIIDRDDFVVYQITDMRRPENGVMQYRLHFMCGALINAQKQRLYRTYQGPYDRTISELVKTIYRDIDDVSKLSITVDDQKCYLNNPFVSPGYTPLQAIEELAKRASVSGDYYLFFERLSKLDGKSHFFASTKTMKEYGKAFSRQGMITIRHNVSAMTLYTPGSNGFNFNATNIEFVDNYNHMQNMMSGLYNSNIKMLDLVSRSFTDVRVNYEEIMGTNPLSVNSGNIFDQFKSYDNPGERIVVRGRNDSISNSGAWLKIDAVNSVVMSMFRLIVTMPGNNILGVGNYINLQMPSDQARTLNIGAGILQNDSVYSGNYLITAVKHTLNLKEYIKRIEVSKIDNSINTDNMIVNDLTPPPLYYGPPSPFETMSNRSAQSNSGGVINNIYKLVNSTVTNLNYVNALYGPPTPPDSSFYGTGSGSGSGGGSSGGGGGGGEA